ncbi:MAG: RICIN domain-containing protein [Sphingobacteriales bacterium]|nr:RICIN domain-containing protein [Sphingobacteriales bacterium]
MKPPSVNAATFLLTLLCLTDIWAQPSVFDRQRIHSNQINEAAVSTKVYLFPLESGVYRIEFGNYALQQVASKEAVKLAIANSVNSYQHWIFTQNGNNTYTISNFESGRCLSHDAATGKLQTTSCQGNDDQQWLLKGNKGNFSLQNKATKQYILLYSPTSDKNSPVNNGSWHRLLLAPKLKMTESGKNVSYQIEKQPCDVPLKAKTLREKGNIAVLRPDFKVFLFENISIFNDNTIKTIQQRAEYDEESFGNNNHLSVSAPEAEVEALNKRWNALKEAIDNASSDIRYYLDIDIALIKDITPSALATLNAEMSKIEPLVALDHLDGTQIATVVQSARTIESLLNDTTKVIKIIRYEKMHLSHRTLRFSALTSSGAALNNVKFYVMTRQQFIQNAEFICNYYICQTNTLALASELADSSSAFIDNQYYHAFAVQPRNNDIDEIVGYALVPPIVTLVSIRVD